MSSEEQMVALFKKVTNILERNSITYWMEFGTLLGYVREGRFIPWDHDIDLPTKEFEKVLQSRKQFENEGLRTELFYENINEITTILKVYNSEGFGVDIYDAKTNSFDNLKYTPLSRVLRHLYLKTKNKRVLNLMVRLSYKRKFIYPPVSLKQVSFYGLSTYIPDYPERHLDLWYGKTWPVPSRGDETGKEHLVKYDKKKKTFFYSLEEL